MIYGINTFHPDGKGSNDMSDIKNIKERGNDLKFIGLLIFQGFKDEPLDLKG